MCVVVVLGIGVLKKPPKKSSFRKEKVKVLAISGFKSISRPNIFQDTDSGQQE